MAFQVLFHGTSSIFLKCLLKCGLLPRSKTKNSAYEGKLTSSEDRVYLTSVYPLMFGMNAVHKFGGDLLIVQSRVSESRLEPDTDFTDEGLHERKFANWNECLENTGCVCVQGVVRPSRMFLLDAKSETIAPVLSEASHHWGRIGLQHHANMAEQLHLLGQAMLHGECYVQQKRVWWRIQDGKLTQLGEADFL